MKKKTTNKDNLGEVRLTKDAQPKWRLSMRSDEIRVGNMVMHRAGRSGARFGHLKLGFGIVLEEPYNLRHHQNDYGQARVYWINTNHSTIIHPDHLEEAR